MNQKQASRLRDRFERVLIAVGVRRSSCQVELLSERVSRLRLSKLSKKLSACALHSVFRSSDQAYGRFFISVSHSKNVVLAVALRIKEGRDLRGFGVDVEEPRQTNSRLEKRVLNPSERKMLVKNKLDLIDAWTMKEAAFKADPKNSTNVVWDYRIRRLSGESARLENSEGRQFRVSYFRMDGIRGAVAFFE